MGNSRRSSSRMSALEMYYWRRFMGVSWPERGLGCSSLPAPAIQVVCTRAIPRVWRHCTCITEGMFVFVFCHVCNVMSTAVEQVVTCAPVTQPARVRFPVGTSFLQNKCQEVLGPQVPRISFGRHNHPFIFALLEWMGAWMVFSFFMFVLFRRWPRHWADPSFGESLNVLVWSKKVCIVCDPKLIPTGRDSVRPGWRESRKSTYIGEVNLR